MSTSAKTSRNIQFALLGLNFVFVLIIILELTRDYEVAVNDGTDTQLTVSNNIIAPDTSLKPLDEYEQIIERPLFTQYRRPFAATVVETLQRPRRGKANTRKTQDQYLLSAIVITDDKRIALLQSKKSNKLRKFDQGDELDGWTISDIQPTRVLLKKSNENRQLELAVKGSSQQSETNSKNNTQQTQTTEITATPEISGENKPDTNDKPAN